MSVMANSKKDRIYVEPLKTGKGYGVRKEGVKEPDVARVRTTKVGKPDQFRRAG